MIRVVTKTTLPVRRGGVRALGRGVARPAVTHHWVEGDRADSSRHPISRWYVCPLARRFAARLATMQMRAWHLTVAGLVAAVSAMVLLCCGVNFAWLAAPLVWLAWFFDRADGSLARRQRAASAGGAWIDANADEFVDVGLHVAVAYAAAAASSTTAPWLCLAALIGGKYLFMYGLATEQRLSREAGGTCRRQHNSNRPLSLWRRLYHLPANADVRVHLLLAALATGWLTTELAVVALYYNVRWLVRWFLVLRRLEASTA